MILGQLTQLIGSSAWSFLIPGLVVVEKACVRAFGEREKKNKKESIQLALVKGQEEGQVEH